MKLTALPVIIVLLSLSLSVRAEEFDWSWEKGAEEAEEQKTEVRDQKSEVSPEGEKTEVSDQKSVVSGQKPVVSGQKPEEGSQDGQEAEAEKPPVDAAAPAREVSPEEQKTEAAAEPEPFQWTKGADDEEGIAAETREVKAEPEGYDNLLKENLELRRKISEATQAEEKARQENERLSAQLKDMERRSAQFAAVINDLEKEKEKAAGNPDRQKELEAKLAEAERDKAKLGTELGVLRKALNSQKPSPVAAVQPAPEPVKPAAAATAGIQPGSDLFKEKERENAAFKNKLVEIETARRKAVKDREEILKRTERAEEEARQAGERQKELEAKLAAATSAQKETHKTIEKLLEQIPALEKELSALKSHTRNKDSTLTSKERDLQAMEVELQKREQRLIKAERMTVVLEKAREDVAQVSDRERRDMHYNMAVVYTKEGKIREAEAEYLRALRIDPNDPAVHYNLGILYDDELNDKERAAMHYRKYLKLSPHGSDVDAVKGWLLKIEMGQ